MLANSLKNLISLIVLEEQSDFIPERFITGYVIAAFDINHWMMRKTHGKVCYTKTRFEKLYGKK